MEKPELLRFDGATDPEGRTRWLVDRWRLFTNHRQRIAEILCTLTDTQNHRLAVLGAGACTDLDLSRLTTAYKSITLIDIDGEALDCMPLLQKDVNLETIHTCGGVDLTGLYTIFEQWRMHPPDESAISDAMFVAANHRLPELDNGGFHVVLSDCVLSQIIEQTTLAMGESHPQLLRMIRQIRRRHLDLMLDLTNPGGHVVVMTDIVSSLTAPILKMNPPEPLARVMDALIRSGNFFTGCNPYAIKSSCERDLHLRRRINTITLTHPWLWRLQPDRVQLVCCLILQRHSR